MNIEKANKIGVHSYDADLREAIGKGYKDEDEQTKTTLFLPLWLRKIFADINEEYDLPLYVVMSRSIRLGTKIIQHEYLGDIKELNILWKRIRWTNNMYLSKLPDHRFSVNSMVMVKRKFVRLPLWSHGVLEKMGKALNSDTSAMIRLTMYHALMRWDRLPVKCKKHMEKEIAKFEKQINDQLEILRLLAQNEKWREADGSE